MLIYTTTRRRLVLTLSKHLKGCCGQVQVGLFTQVASNSTRGIRVPKGKKFCKLCQWRLRLDISENFFTKRAVKPQNKLLREMVVTIPGGV